MSNANGNPLGTCTVSDGKGGMIELPNLLVQASEVHGFSQMYDIFDGKSQEQVLAKIIERGKAEITRTEKTKVKTAGEKAAGKLLKELNLTPEQALAKLAEAAKIIADAQKAKAEAEQAKAKK